MLDELDKKIIGAMQDEFPLVAEPYREIAQRVGISEAELLDRLKNYLQSGKIRKMGAVLRHRQVGYSANALCAWLVPEDRLEETGKMMASKAVITHCYIRAEQPGWRYNFYTMLHAHTRRECQAIADKLAREAGLSEYIMLFSTKEWKKTSMKYFREI
ncbi:Lrp/AsnC family transcriptional regulator|uniref:siroheme decarboxylase n=1 Tax=Dendrosporobacter quercicolus TaxID=146817 RepID=A0A1G9N7I3_9FIRM|nr:AsnC family transcriptional regulator [Dendrosporobacter quercicolus]NSL47239.1 Lrp/AsnC family transcriptional regulator [Dendrosporobacter quercicolus DSM 1736]SDL81815.1 DNA-binding transcriptional regulator, Lrp family [Dendrosporobacter quercicolus]